MKIKNKNFNFEQFLYKNVKKQQNQIRDIFYDICDNAFKLKHIKIKNEMKKISNFKYEIYYIFSKYYFRHTIFVRLSNVC